MKRNGELDELIENFTFLPNEMKQVGNKSGETRLGFAVLFKFFQCEARFPSQKFEVSKAVIHFIAKQVNVLPELYVQYDWSGRSIPRAKDLFARSSLMIGLLIAPGAIVAAFCTRFVERWIDRYGNMRFLMIGHVLLAGVLALFMLALNQSALIITGGYLFFSPALSASMASLNNETSRILP